MRTSCLFWEMRAETIARPTPPVPPATATITILRNLEGGIEVFGFANEDRDVGLGRLEIPFYY